MDIKEMNIDGHDIRFVNNTWEKRYSWGHETTLYIDDKKINTSKCRYYNRTWECYRYQSIMKNCVSNTMETYKTDFINLYKLHNGIKRLCGQKKEDCMQQLQNDCYYNLLKSAYNSL